MRKMLKIEIQRPCSETWQQFPKTRSGFMLTGHCASCSKNVIDFTNWSEDRIKRYFDTYSTNICGRVRPAQLKEYSMEEPISKPRLGFLSFLLTSWILFSSRGLDAQTIEIPVPEKENVYLINKLFVTTESVEGNICIKGSVIFVEDGSLGMGTNVVQKGSSNGTTVREDGTFILPLKNPGTKVTLIFAFIGFESKEITILQKDYDKEVNMEMLETDVVLGEMIIGRTISPRRWWWNFKDLFSRY